MLRKFTWKAQVSWLFFLYACTGFAQLPEDFHDQLFMGGLEFPTGLTFDPSGQMYVWEKEGKVFVVDTNGVKQPQPLIDITEEVTNWKDHGLMGFTLDRDFPENGYFYLLYAVDPYYLLHFGAPDYNPDSTITFHTTIGRVTRYQADPATGFKTTIPGSRKVLLGESFETGIPITWEFHGLGSLITGEDGTLLISCGDGSSTVDADTGGDSLGTMATQALSFGILTPDQDLGSYRSQYLGNLNGKILRIDPETGDGLPSNPFYDPETPRSARSRIWELGFRNPYRIVIQPNSGSHYPAEGRPGRLFIGDVGNGSWEELNIADRGGLNFGWPLTEGYSLAWNFYIKDCPGNPLAPNPLFGQGDCSQAFFTFRDLGILPNTEENTAIAVNPCDPNQPITENTFLQMMPVMQWSNAMWNPPMRAQTLGFHPAGFPIGIDIADSTSTVSGEAFNGFSSLAGVFYTGNSFPEHYIGKYFAVDFSGWIRVFDFDAQHHLHAVERFHDHSKDIIHLALNPVDGCLYYINLEGEIRKISYGGNPPPTAVIEADRFFGPGPLEVQFKGENSHDELPIVAYSWDFGDGNTSTEKNPIHTFTASTAEPFSYEVSLTITDSLGATGTAHYVVSLNNTPPSVDISSFSDGDLYPTDRTTVLMLNADVKDLEAPLDNLQYEWRVFLHHNEHFHPEPPIYDPHSFVLISPLGCFGEEYSYRIELKVTDPAGLSSIDSKKVYPYCGSDIVEWTLLEASPREESIELRWIVRPSTPIARFVVQRSSDFFNFESLGTENATGGGLLDQVYSFIDKHPLVGSNIYRIKVIAENGAFTYSNLVVLTYPNVALMVKVYPNPATDFIQIQMQEPISNKFTWELFDALGRRRQNLKLNIATGIPLQHTIDISYLEKGPYFYRLTNGSKQQIGKILLK